MYYQTNPSPEAYIARGKNRIKVYADSKVYLKDGENFSIELFNPTHQVIGAKISLNGTYISSSVIVIKPGQRAFIERFIDSSNKFLFTTYDVSGTSQQVKEATANNGTVKVEFYREANTGYTNYNITTTTIGNPYYPFNLTGGTCNIFNSSTVPTGVSGSTGISGLTGSSGPLYSSSVNYCDSSGTVTTSCDFLANSSTTFTTTGTSTFHVEPPEEKRRMKKSLDKTVETGRVERGSQSSQKFDTYNGSFESFSFYSVQYQILPESTRAVQAEEIRQFCTGCGAKMKKQSWKFCPSCGSKA